MGEVEITVKITGADIGMGDPGDDTIDRATEWRVKRRPPSCIECMTNEDISRIPLHPHCDCTIELVEVDE